MVPCLHWLTNVCLRNTESGDFLLDLSFYWENMVYRLLNCCAGAGCSSDIDTHAVYVGSVEYP